MKLAIVYITQNAAVSYLDGPSALGGGVVTGHE
jgi:hypothetical protein